MYEQLLAAMTFGGMPWWLLADWCEENGVEFPVGQTFASAPGDRADEGLPPLERFHGSVRPRARYGYLPRDWVLSTRIQFLATSRKTFSRRRDR